MLLRFTLVLPTTSGAEVLRGGEWAVTAGEKHYTGLGTAEPTSWELPEGRHRHYTIKSTIYTVTGKECRVKLATDNQRTLLPGMHSLGGRTAGGRSPGPGAKKPSCATPELGDFMESQSCFYSCKLEAINYTSQSCHEDEIRTYIKVLNTEPGT